MVQTKLGVCQDEEEAEKEEFFFWEQWDDKITGALKLKFYMI